MGILKKVFGQEEEEQRTANSIQTEHECPHTSLVPHWDSPDDMGKSDRATYRCEACGQVFSFDQAQKFLNQAPEAVASIRPDR